MRRPLLFVALLVVAATTSADPGGRRPSRPPGPGPGYGNGLDIWVPIDPYEHERTWFMHRSDRSLVPPAVSIDRDPYVCDLDQRRFADRERFVAHLRGEHGIPRDDIRRGIYQVDGLVHFAAE
ncbi:MAG: hypothetical protein KIT14_03715 [bacterium]|nr:hypothetical protein [bacterium]